MKSMDEGGPAEFEAALYSGGTSHGLQSHHHAHLHNSCTYSLRKYTGRCVHDVTVTHPCVIPAQN
jgi:hypothetical protein